MRTTKILIIGVAVLMLGAVGWSALSTNQSAKDDAMMQKGSAMAEKTDDAMMQKEDTAMMTKNIIISIGALNASGQTGKATLSDMNGKTKVVLDIASGARGVPQPSHIHIGSCPTPSAIVYPLSAVVNGKAETILDVSFETLGGKLPLAIMVHKSKDEVKTFVSCGDLPKEGLSTMMEKKSEGAMMATAGSYDVYSPEKIAKAATGKVVLFFRAGWCPTCKALDTDIRSHLKDIPAEVTILDVDYDNSTTLKQKYGVTYQHTLVQVDASGNQITKWSGGLTLAEFITNIK